MLGLMETCFYESTNESVWSWDRQFGRKLEKSDSGREKELVDIATNYYKACKPKEANFAQNKLKILMFGTLSRKTTDEFD